MDISELPRYGIVLFVLVMFVALFVVAKRLSRKWVRWPVRGVTSLGAGLTVLLIALFVFGDYSCTARAPKAYSPDGKHVAIITWGLQGALGADMATVTVRHRYSPFARNVYSGPGESDYPRVRATGPQVRWVDNKHLLVRYCDWPGSDQICASHSFGIEVICERLPSQCSQP